MNRFEEAKQQLAAYFDRMGIPQECNVCGVNDWFVYSIEGAGRSVVSGKTHQPTRIYCNNCGRIAEYDLKKATP
jgi:hypothetical protein